MNNCETKQRTNRNGTITNKLLLATALVALTITAQAQTWTKLPGHTNLPSAWRTFPGSVDTSRGIVYSLSENGVFWKYDIQSNAFTQLPVSGWPATRVDTCIYNPEENTIWFTLYGRGQVFRLPVTGGAVASVGASGASLEDFGDVTFWNPVTHKFGTAFGYGFFAVRNWRWEFGTNDVDWVQIEANVPGREPWNRVVGFAAMDFSAKRLFVYADRGNSTGAQGYCDPGFTCDGVQFEHLRDLWSLNLQSNQWSKLIPLNTSIPVEGRIVYFPPLDALFMINGNKIPLGSGATNGLWSFTIGQSTNWTQVSATGDIPSVSDEIVDSVASAFYDIQGRRILHFNNKGVYALTLGPLVSLIKAVKPSFSYLSVGTNYQLQLSGDLNTWTNHGTSFTATNSSMIYPQYWDVDNWGSLFFRLQSIP